MTNKEAIEKLDILRFRYRDAEGTEFRMAIDLAIKALEEKEEHSQYPSELHRIVARKEETDRAADALDKHIAEWEAKYGSKI